VYVAEYFLDFHSIWNLWAEKFVYY